jgi:radical SAM-linked protein
MGGWSAAEAFTAGDLETFCRQPLPWDHIDTGVDKEWLAEDLRRALAAAVVPDCSFEGCSSCGVCGPDLGHNVVIPPPPIPPRIPARAPASERVCRLRFGFAKTGSLALISHLDTLRLLERALRRSGLPVSFSGGFHPLPRLQVALPLPLGVEGLEELFDLEFAAPMDPGEALRRLQAELPEDLTLLSALAVPLAGPSLVQQIRAAQWRFSLRPQESEAAPAPERWRSAIDALLAADTLLWHDRDKRGRPRERECRPYLLDLRPVAPCSDRPEGRVQLLDLEAAVDPQGCSLRPDQLRHWLSGDLGQALTLGAMQRRSLQLRPC